MERKIERIWKKKKKKPKKPKNRTQENVELYQKISHTCTLSPTEDKTEN